MPQIRKPLTILCNTDRCELCGRISTRLVCDHDARTDLIRGWLCQPCNVGLGMFGDTVDALRAAIMYLERPRSGLTWTEYHREKGRREQREMRKRRRDSPEWKAHEASRSAIKWQQKKAHETVEQRAQRLQSMRDRYYRRKALRIA